jgi:hypothetical protein
MDPCQFLPKDAPGIGVVPTMSFGQAHDPCKVVETAVGSVVGSL